eukprot:456612-Hanusia_phi.AAC.1
MLPSKHYPYPLELAPKATNLASLWTGNRPGVHRRGGRATRAAARPGPRYAGPALRHGGC